MDVVQRAGVGLSVPAPSNFVNVVSICQSVEAALPHTSDLSELQDASAKLRALDEYVAATSTSGRQAIAATLRRIEVRVGEVLGPTTRGARTDLEPSIAIEGSLTRFERSQFRSMAQHADVVEGQIGQGTDDKPTSRRQVLTAIAKSKMAAAEPDRDDWDISDEADAIVAAGGDADDAIESRRTPMPVPKPTVADGVPPHPAAYPEAIMDLFAELIPVGAHVLDPFAGVGTIHQLHGTNGIRTVGIELEPEWAAAHPNTRCGDSSQAHKLLADLSFDVIATSPAYGNRLADNYAAADPQSRRSYSIDLGRSVSPGSGAGMHYGRDGRYEVLHEQVWWSVSQLLRPGGLFLLNCKDFVRDGKVVPVTGWHIGALARCGLIAVDLRCLPAAGLPYTSAKPISEVVVVFEKRP